MTGAGVFARDDTMFGVCEALGEDFGFNSNWLRALLGVGLLFNPVGTFALYAALAALVVPSRLLVPARRPAPPEESEAVEAATSGNSLDDRMVEELALAA